MNRLRNLISSFFVLTLLGPLAPVQAHDTHILMWRPGLIKDAGGLVTRRLNPDGSVEDGSEIPMGHIDHQGMVYARDGMMLAIMHPDHTITNREGMVLGQVDKKGVIHGDRKILGTIHQDGVLRDPQGTLLATFPKDDQAVAVLYVLGDLP